MEERMLMTEALDERELLAKKIRDKIQKASFIDIIKRNESRAWKSYKEKEAYTREAEAAYQQIRDLIHRYGRINIAITESNSKTFAQTSFGTYSITGAIALKARLKNAGRDKELDFENILYEKMGKEYTDAVVEMDKKNQQLHATADTMRQSILGKEAKSKEEQPLAVVDAYVQENSTVLLDPLDVLQKMTEMKEKQDALRKELETKIKISNATTYITF